MDARRCSFYGRWLRSRALKHDDYSVRASASDARKSREGFNAIQYQVPGIFCNAPHYKEGYPFIGFEEDAIQEETVISDKHTVSTYFREGKLSHEKLVSLSTLHKHHNDDVLALNYSNDLKGGGDFDMNILHYFDSNSTFSACFCSGSYCDPILEFKFDQQTDRKRVSQRLLANFKTGEKRLCLESKKALGGILMKRTFTTNTKDQHTSRLEMDIPFSSSFRILQSVATDFKEGMDFSINLSKSICKCNFMSASLSTNLCEVNCISIEAKHEVNKHRDASLKLTNDLQGGKQLTISMSSMKGNNHFACNFSKNMETGKSLVLEWRHERSSYHYVSIQATARDLTFSMFTELSIPL